MFLIVFTELKTKEIEMNIFLADERFPGRLTPRFHLVFPFFQQQKRQINLKLNIALTCSFCTFFEYIL